MPRGATFIDLTGQVFGRLTVIARAPSVGDGRAMWRCQCECGEPRVVAGKSLRSGNTLSCGCLHRALASSANKTHGKSRSPLYAIWKGIKKRCYSPKCNNYESYGGRGIRVCERWLNSFEAFRDDMGERPTPRHQLDRFPDNNGNYEPGNCRWATRTQNGRNTRHNRVVEFRGEKRCLSEWGELLGISSTVIYTRLYQGWSVERALTEPLRTWPVALKAS